MWNGIKITDIISASVSLVATGFSFWAIWQTKKQIELSNKQQLFEKRLRSLNNLVSLEQTCRYSLKEINHILDSKNIEELLLFLTIGDFFDNFHIELITSNDNEKNAEMISNKIKGKKKLLESVKKLGYLSYELNFLFEEGEEIKSGTDFIDAYESILTEILTYYHIPNNDREVEKIQQKFSILNNAYQRMVDLKVEEKLKKSIKLF